MPVQFLKPNPAHAQATAQRVSEINGAMVEMCRAVAPAVQKACEEMGRSLAGLKKHRPE